MRGINKPFSLIESSHFVGMKCFFLKADIATGKMGTQVIPISMKNKG